MTHLNYLTLHLLSYIFTIFTSYSFQITTKHPFHKVSLSSKQNDINDELDIILFGIGDLRIKDHGGIYNTRNKKNILPLLVLDTQDTLPNLPGIHAHTLTTSLLLSNTIQNLQTNLKQYNLDLCIYTGDSIKQCLLNIFNIVKFDRVNLHVCDLGDADVSMNYHPYSFLKDMEFEGVSVIPWTCRLRSQPWEDANAGDFPTSYPEYHKKYCNVIPNMPYPDIEQSSKSLSTTINSINATQVTILSLLLSSINFEEHANLKEEQNTGLFGTHWGGTNQGVCSEDDTWDFIHTYNSKPINDFLQNDYRVYQNEKSLEHASLSWMMNDGSKNLINDELITRYLAAPLFFGCISCRQLWHAGTREIAEFREWHVVLAHYNLRNEEEYLPTNKIQYKYWRYHGFLARYAIQTSSKPTLVLIHGFGASGSQWKKLMKELDAVSILAPDLLGFGHAEKPGLTFTQYLWEGFVREFIREKCREDFYIAGNSIGGYTSMGVAADDVGDFSCSATGALGTGRCKGVILLNSAGRLYSKQEIATLEKSNTLTSIAQATITNSLGPCNPPPKILATLGGKALLWYLRPRIQSICKNLYPANPSAVDQTLCTNILRDSLDPGAINVMISGSKLPPPRTANELLNADFGNFATGWSGPVLVCQGMKDPLNDAVGRAEMFRGLRGGIDLVALEGAGHCPHDELPHEVGNAVRNWMDSH